MGMLYELDEDERKSIDGDRNYQEIKKRVIGLMAILDTTYDFYSETDYVRGVKFLIDSLKESLAEKELFPIKLHIINEMENQ